MHSCKWNRHKPTYVKEEAMMSAAMETAFQTDACLSHVKPDADIAGPYRILLAEDDKEMRMLLELALKRSGYEVVACPDGADMLIHLAAFLMPCDEVHESFDLIISDIRMPGFTGMEVLEGKPERADFPPMILITAFGDDETHAQAAKYGAAAMFDKPFDVDELLKKVNAILLSVE
jgi:DNA-binding response OmpR family regulator